MNIFRGHGDICQRPSGMSNRAYNFIEQAKSLGREEEYISSLLLVGSYARGDFRADSDIDIIFLCRDPEQLLRSPVWIYRWGEVKDLKQKRYLTLETFEVVFADDLRVEIGVALEFWLKDSHEEVARILGKGMVTLVTKGNL